MMTTHNYIWYWTIEEGVYVNFLGVQSPGRVGRVVGTSKKTGEVTTRFVTSVHKTAAKVHQEINKIAKETEAFEDRQACIYESS